MNFDKKIKIDITNDEEKIIEEIRKNIKSDLKTKSFYRMIFLRGLEEYKIKNLREKRAAELKGIAYGNFDTKN